MFYSDLEFLAGLLQGSRPLVLLQQHPIVDLTSESWYIKKGGSSWYYQLTKFEK